MNVFSLVFAVLFMASQALGSGDESESGGANRSALETRVDYEVGHMRGSIKDFYAPSSLIKNLEQIYIQSFRAFDEVRAKSMKDSEIMLNSDRKYLKMEVVLDDDGRGALSKPVRFALPRGGGRVDLAPFITNKRANFNLKIRVAINDGKTMSSEPSESGVRAFFVSRTIKRKLLGEDYGVGCNDYLDISGFYNTHLYSGVQLNTTEQRYLSVIGGTFFFILAQKGELHLGAIDVVNSKHPELFCPKNFKTISDQTNKERDVL